MDGSASPLAPPAMLGLIDEDPAGQGGGQSEELVAILPVVLPLRDEAQERLMHQLGGSQRDADALAGQKPPRQLLELWIDESEEVFPGLRIPGGPGLKPGGYGFLRTRAALDGLLSMHDGSSF